MASTALRMRVTSAPRLALQASTASEPAAPRDAASAVRLRCAEAMQVDGAVEGEAVEVVADRDLPGRPGERAEAEQAFEGEMGARDVGDRTLRLLRDEGDVEGFDEIGQGGDAAGELRRHALFGERARARVPGGQGLRRQGRFEAAFDLRDAGAKGTDHHVEGGLAEIDVADEPDDAAHQQVLKIRVELELQGAGHEAVEGVDGGVEIGEAEGIPRRRIGRRDGRRVGAGLVDEARDERRSAAVDDGVGELRRDDLAAQPVRRDGVAEALAQFEPGNSARARGRDRDRPARGLSRSASCSAILA